MAVLQPSQGSGSQCFRKKLSNMSSQNNNNPNHLVQNIVQNVVSRASTTNTSQTPSNNNTTPTNPPDTSAMKQIMTLFVQELLQQTNITPSSTSSQSGSTAENEALLQQVPKRKPRQGHKFGAEENFCLDFKLAKVNKPKKSSSKRQSASKQTNPKSSKRKMSNSNLEDSPTDDISPTSASSSSSQTYPKEAADTNKMQHFITSFLNSTPQASSNNNNNSNIEQTHFSESNFVPQQPPLPHAPSASPFNSFQSNIYDHFETNASVQLPSMNTSATQHTYPYISSSTSSSNLEYLFGNQSPLLKSVSSITNVSSMNDLSSLLSENEEALLDNNFNFSLLSNTTSPPKVKSNQEHSSLQLMPTVLMDLDGKIVEYNTAFTQFVELFAIGGNQSRGCEDGCHLELVNQNFYHFVHSSQRKEFLQQVIQYIDQQTHSGQKDAPMKQTVLMNVPVHCSCSNGKSSCSNIQVMKVQLMVRIMANQTQLQIQLLHWENLLPQQQQQQQETVPSMICTILIDSHGVVTFQSQNLKNFFLKHIPTPMHPQLSLENYNFNWVQQSIHSIPILQNTIIQRISAADSQSIQTDIDAREVLPRTNISIHCTGKQLFNQQGFMGFIWTISNE